jgi:hypothetical protein
VLAPPKQPPHDEPEALMEEARERQRRRRLFAAAGIAIAAGLALAVYAVSGGFHQSRTARAPLGPGGVPLCRSSQISVELPMLTGVIEAGRTGLFVLTNKSSSQCSLPLRPPRESASLGTEPSCRCNRCVDGASSSGAGSRFA